MINSLKKTANKDKNLNLSPLILGISAFGHDSSCALIDGNSGKILFALTEERFSNVKHDSSFPAAAISKIKEKVCIEKLGSISQIALNFDSSSNITFLESYLKSTLDLSTASLVLNNFLKFVDNAQIIHPDFFPLNYITQVLEQKKISSPVIKSIQDKISLHGNFILKHYQLNKILNKIFPNAEIIPVAHHLAHAASAFYGSGFKTSAILTLDGQGEISTASLGQASNNKIKLIRQTDWPNSLGVFYMQLTWHLGFTGNDLRYLGYGDEFKVMGMSAYGKPKYLDLFRELGCVNSKGEFKFNFNSKHVKLTPVEGCDGHLQPDISVWFHEQICPRRLEGEPFLQKHYDLACSGQRFLEEIVVKMAKNLKKYCPNEKNICIAGGVALNGLMNMRIFQEAGFENIFIQPASGDDGTSLGAAWYVYHMHLGRKRCKKMDNAFLGLNYENTLIETELKKQKIKYIQPKSIHKEIGHLLNKGLVVARYVGRSEFGPRALGHRSILANPKLNNIKDTLNSKIKHREPFRPFAPACLDHEFKKYFHITTCSPYMLLICKAKDGVKLKIPAVVHEDETARLQTVNKNENQDLYKIISEFHRLSKIPVILNTSFNVNGETIVETPQDAIESFLFMSIDYLAIGPFLVSYKDNIRFNKFDSRQELIETRRTRYKKNYFVPERFFWSSNEPLETRLSLLRNELERFKSISKKEVKIYKKAAEERLLLIQKLKIEHKKEVNIYKKAAEERLLLIKQLDAELKKKSVS